MTGAEFRLTGSRRCGHDDAEVGALPAIRGRADQLLEGFLAVARERLDRSGEWWTRPVGAGDDQPKASV